MLRAAVSGSFHRHMLGVYESVGELRALGVDVLSPSDPRVVDAFGEFLFVASDRLRSVKLVQDRHLEAIRQADFLWVVCPDGYTGVSTSGEIMAAFMVGCPVYSLNAATDVTMGEYVRVVTSMRSAVELTHDKRQLRHAMPPSILLDPEAGAQNVLTELEQLVPALNARGGRLHPEQALARARRKLHSTFGMS